MTDSVSGITDEPLAVVPELDVEEIEEILISIVRNKPELWNSLLDCYRNRDMKSAAWKAVESATGQNESWCKTKWQKLRDGFNRKKKALKGKTGQARKKLESTGHFLGLTFLDDIPTIAMTSGNVVEQLESHHERNDDNLDQQRSEQVSGESLVQNSSVVSTPANSSVDERNPTYSSTRSRKRPNDEVDKELVAFLKRPKQTEDEFYHFGQGVAGQLRKMHGSQYQWAMMTIQRVLFDASQIPPPPTQTTEIVPPQTEMNETDSDD